MTTVLNYKLYDWRVEWPAATMMKAVLIAADKAYDLVALKLGTDLKTNFAVTIEVMSTPFGIKFERNGVDNIAVTLVAANHEVIVKDLIVDTDFQTKIAIKMNILNNEVGIRLQRDSLKKNISCIDC